MRMAMPGSGPGCDQPHSAGFDLRTSGLDFSMIMEEIAEETWVAEVCASPVVNDRRANMLFNNQNEPGHNSLKSSRRFELLTRLYHAYPGRWSESSLKRLLRDLAIVKVACSQEKLHRTMEQLEEELLFPLAEICVMQHEKLITIQTAVSEKEQKLISSILTLQEEKIEIKQGLSRQSMFVETLLQDFDEMAKSMDHSKKTQRHLEQKLEQKDADLQLMISEKKELIKKFVTLGSDAVLEWAKQEARRLDPVEIENTAHDLVEHVHGPKENGNMCNCISSTPIALQDGCKITLCAQADAFVTSLSSVERKRPSLAFVTLTGILEESLASLSELLENGIFALPSAVIHFWIGLSGRITRHVTETFVMSVKHSPLGFCMEQL